ncbi:MAG TPA: FmdB family zinc ribbon protein, partial [Acidimicrobiales bacterium]|nr:FmdB family zinc ribbon protein [Acidimicrobiales bacterium]
MPTYEYACKTCGEHLEIVQSFRDDALTECPVCAGPLRKVFGSIGIAFKGSGFYRNDSRSDGHKAAGKGSETKEAKSESKAESGLSSTKSGASGGAGGGGGGEASSGGRSGGG